MVMSLKKNNQNVSEMLKIAKAFCGNFAFFSIMKTDVD